MKKASLHIVNWLLIIVTFVSTFASLLLLYYKTIGKDKIPSAVTSTYATTVVDPQTGEKRPVIEANYYSNNNGTGYEVIELLFNCYSGISKQAIYSRGFQLVYDKNGNVVINDDVENTYDVNGNIVYNNHIFQYNKYGNVSFETGHDYSWGDPMIIDIDGKTFAVKLDGKQTISYKKYSFLKSVGHLFTGLFTGYDFSTKAFNFGSYEQNYTFKDLLLKVGEIIKSSSNGTGDSVIPLIDLGDFLHIYEIDDNGQISAEPLGVHTLQNSYFTVSTHYDNRGMVWAKQSIFESVAGDSQFNISGITADIDYWQARNQVIITEKDFTARYYSADGGFYYSLSTKKLNELKNFENIDIDVIFDVSNFTNVNVLGFDYYALYGIEINSLTIRSDIQKDFKLLVSSLKDTGLIEIKTENINIVNVNSGVEL